MSARRWFLMFGCVLLPIVIAIAAFNIIVDPFSVFGDRFYSWYSYGMTNNPKTAKFDYVDNRLSEFDAFIIGPSGASGIAPEILEEYTGLRWYNMFNYGADIRYTRKLAEYLVPTHQPKQILLCLPTVSARIYAEPQNELAFAQPLTAFWRVPFVFADPKFAMRKLENLDKISYIQQHFDVFIAETGVYNKTRRDAEAIGGMEEYFIAYPEFVNPWFARVRLENIKECAAAVAAIADICRQYGTELTIVTSPILAENVLVYDVDEVQLFFETIAEISGFWDFSVSSVSSDPRYFYDVTHFRNSVGDMMIARMYGDESVYMPDDFGLWVTRENAADAAALFTMFDDVDDNGYVPDMSHTMDLPVLTYHHIGEEADNVPTVSPAHFEEQMRALYEAGYSAVSLADLRNYVFKGYDLPEQSVVITFNDGYMSSYTEAFPVLQRYGFNAAVFVFGASLGGTETGNSIPRLGAAEAREMSRSGLISIQSQSYDELHSWLNYYPFQTHPSRLGVRRMEGETEADYISAFRDDFERMSHTLRETTGEDMFAFSYPHGFHDMFSSILLRNLGTVMTFTMEPGVNTLIKGLPQSLYELKRFAVTDEMAGYDIVDLLYGSGVEIDPIS